MVLREKGVPYEVQKIVLRTGDHKTPEYMAMQPFGQVPYIVSEISSSRSELHSKLTQCDFVIP
jgi:glutathione S-transferase